jgi:hypothetical protein
MWGLVVVVLCLFEARQLKVNEQVSIGEKTFFQQYLLTFFSSMIL